MWQIGGEYYRVVAARRTVAVLERISDGFKIMRTAGWLEAHGKYHKSYCAGQRLQNPPPIDIQYRVEYAKPSELHRDGEVILEAFYEDPPPVKLCTCDTFVIVNHGCQCGGA